MRHHLVSGKSLPAWILLLVGLAISVLAFLQQRASLREDAQREFAFAADQVAIKIQERLAAHELILRGAAALFAGSDEVSREEWRSYVKAVHPESIVPGIQGVGYATVIAAAELPAHIDAVRAEGFPDYRVHPEGERPLYTSIVFLEPFRDRNLRAFGYDMYSEPVRRAAMEQARDSGQATLSGPVRLVQETESDVQTGALMYVPVYRHGLPTDSLQQRRAALQGWAYSPYRMADLMAGILGDWESARGRWLDLHIYDGDSGGERSLLFSSRHPGREDLDSAFSRSLSIDFHGHRWRLQFHRMPDAPGIDQGPAWVVLGAGSLLSLLLFALVLSLLNTSIRASRMADELTVEIRQRERELADSEMRWRFAIEGAGDGLWDWNVSTGKVLFSARWKAMLGHTEDEIGDSLEEWESRLHPDDREATLAVVKRHLDGSDEPYVCEHRLRCKDGSYKWILDRGKVVSRDAAGNVLRMIGTHTDIDPRKQLEASLRARQAELEEAQRIARIGSWRLDLQTGDVRWTEQLYRMFGLDTQLPAPGFAEHPGLFTADAWQRLSEAVTRTRETGTPYEVELETVQAGSGQHGWMLARGEALRSEDGRIIALRGIAADITERVHARNRIEHLSKLYAALSACNWAIVHCRDEAELLQRVCEVVVRQGGARMAWLGKIDGASLRILPVHAYGDGTAYLDGIVVSVDGNDPHGRGPTGTAARENRPVWLDDFRAASSTTPWKQRAQPYGWRASAAVPICRQGRPIGALTFYSADAGWFDMETRSLLEEMGANISYALDKLDADAAAQAAQATLIESEQRFRSLVEQTIAGAFILREGRFVYANPRAGEILGLADAQALQGRLLLDCAADKDRPRLQQRLYSLAAGEATDAEWLFTARRGDGSEIEVALNATLAQYQSSPAVIGLMQDISDRHVAEQQIRRYAAQLEHTFLQTVGLANTLSEMRDPYTAGHERRVAELAVAIGRELGFDDHRLEGLRVGGYLHDVGKLTIPAEILAKPSRLNEVEYELIKGHARAGHDVLKEVDFPWPVALIALQHHERLDGSGYPQGLRGEQIIFEARIVAVADVVESMASHRPYRPGLGIDKALDEIAAGRGSRYEATVVDACTALFREGRFDFSAAHADRARDAAAAG